LKQDQLYIYFYFNTVFPNGTEHFLKLQPVVGIEKLWAGVKSHVILLIFRATELLLNNDLISAKDFYTLNYTRCPLSRLS
jgi:hypothetical protein